MSELWLSPVVPALSAGMASFLTAAYGVLLLALLLGSLPQARRFFLSERWGGYAQSSPFVDAIHNPVVMPLVLAVWLAAAAALVLGRLVVPAALVNAVFCHYFFVQMRWRGVLRGMGAPGFIAYWLGVAVLLVEYTRRSAPELQSLALFVLLVDFALIMFSAGAYKAAAGYRHNEGMEFGLVNPEWGYWHRFWGARPATAWYFRVFNELAWSTEVVAAVLMLVPQTRFLGATLILISFIFIATQIRLGVLCEMVIVCCLLFAHPGSVLDTWVGALGLAAPPAAEPGSPLVRTAVHVLLWTYLLLLPAARAGLAYNFHAKRALPAALQTALDRYTNLFGLILWRVFSADVTNFFVNVHAEDAAGGRRLLSSWGRSLRFSHVGESIAVTSLFTTLKYYPSNNRLFAERLLRYARTLPQPPGGALVFEWVGIRKGGGFAYATAAEYVVDAVAGTFSERVQDPAAPLRRPADASPVHEGARPGSYAPAPR